MRKEQRYEVLIEKKEVCRVVVHAASPEEAQERAYEEERRGDVESSAVVNAHCIGCVAIS